jgi:hypothetical protein
MPHKDSAEKVAREVGVGEGEFPEMAEESNQAVLEIRWRFWR